MPKKHKKTSKNRKSPKNTREAKPTHELPGGFWRQIIAVLMLATALFAVITWFGHGGSVFNNIHQASLNFIGIATYGVPFLLIYLAIKILRAEDNRVAFPVYLSSVLVLVWLAGIGGIWDHGGIVGNGLNSLMLNILDQGVVILIYLVLLFVTLAFLFALSPVTFFKGAKNLTHPHKKSTSTANAEANGQKLGDVQIKVNTGLDATEPEAASPKRRRLIHAKTAKSAPAPVAKVAPQPEPTALTFADDPDWKFPPLSLLSRSDERPAAENVRENADVIKSTLADFGINVKMEEVNVGPRVTQYTMTPPPGVNLGKILARQKELALGLAVDEKVLRIEAPIPGTRLVGVEIPNTKNAVVSLRSVLESDAWKQTKTPLTFAVGQDAAGKPYVADLADMPHLLIAGTTGTGKSVMTNSLITSLLYRNSPTDLKFIFVDPKFVEMSVYNNIPHLLTPVINDTEKALSAMKWSVNEMERRYQLMSEVGVRKISDYNAKVAQQNSELAEKSNSATAISSADDQTTDADNPSIDTTSSAQSTSSAQPTPVTQPTPSEPPLSKMPYIVILIDEMSDLMMQAGKDLENLIVRIAQKGRAAGVHLVLATQRPEAKVITGLIKSNVPARIAFAVSSQMDSRIILDQSGAEKLLGSGDMLLLTTQMRGKARRIQGTFAKDKDIKKVADFLRKQRPAEYNDEVIAQPVSLGGPAISGGGALGEFGRRFDPNDPLVRRAVEITLEKGKFSTASLQTYLSKSHGFVSGLAIWLEEIGVIGPPNGNKPRELLISSMEEFDALAGV